MTSFICAPTGDFLIELICWSLSVSFKKFNRLWWSCRNRWSIYWLGPVLWLRGRSLICSYAGQRWPAPLLLLLESREAILEVRLKKEILCKSLPHKQKSGHQKKELEQ